MNAKKPKRPSVKDRKLKCRLRRSALRLKKLRDCDRKLQRRPRD